MKLSLRTFESSSWFVAGSLSFRFMLEWSYIQFVNPIFESAGFLFDFDILKYLESWFLFIFLVAIAPKRMGRPSDYFMVILICLTLVPLLVFYGLSNASREHLYIVLLCVLLVEIFRRGLILRLPTVKNGKLVALAILSFGALGVTAWMIRSGGLNFFNLNFMKVYEFREDVGALINQGIMGYMNAWAKFVFGPMLLAIALWKKNYLIVFALLCLHLLWFGITGHKGIIFYPVLVIFAWLGFKSARGLALIPIALSCLVALAMAAFVAFGDTLLGSLFIRRVFFVPSFLTFTYFDFFSQNQFVYWSNSLATNFLAYPYDLHPAKVIGKHLGTNSHANNSFLSTGYMHAGVLGVIFYGPLVGLIFRLIDSIAFKGMPLWFGVAATVVPIQTMITSGDLPTSLLTGGGGITILLLFLCRSKALKDAAFKTPHSNQDTISQEVKVQEKKS